MLEGNRRNSIFDSLLTARGPRCEASNNLGARVAECVGRLRPAAAPRPETRRMRNPRVEVPGSSSKRMANWVA